MRRWRRLMRSSPGSRIRPTSWKACSRPIRATIPMPEPLDNLARELRSAVLASDHEKATRLVAEYAEALGRHWTALSGNERAASPLPQQSLELLNWVRKMT